MEAPTDTHLFDEPARRRLVNLCAVVSGDREAAEDLAQETLLEAWRNTHKLRDPAGADRWLAAIARNVCRRWARRRGRDLAASDAIDDTAAETAAGVDLEADLERAELAELLDRALALLPAETRDVLIHRYVHESPHAEIAARLGVSEDAVSMRLSRGKLVLRRVLASELSADSTAYGFLDPVEEAWQETRLWCSQCGQRKLHVVHKPPTGIAFRCPQCDSEPAMTSSEFRVEHPFFASLVGDLVRPAAILTRAAGWARGYFGGGIDGPPLMCTRCGRAVPLRRGFRPAMGSHAADSYVLFTRCDGCGDEAASSLSGVALNLEAVRRFRSEHPRTRALPRREAVWHGTRAVVVGYEDLLGRATIDVVFSRDTLRVLAVEGA